MNIDSEAINTRYMQLHSLNKQKNERANPSEIDLGYCVNVRESFLLNCKGELKHIFNTENNLNPIYSDVDEQMMIKLSFEEVVSITQFGIKVFKQSNQGQVICSSPKLVKLYVNSPLSDFSEIEDMEPCFTINFKQDDTENCQMKILPGSKFYRVKHLTIFIQENQDNVDISFLNYVKIVGYVLAS
ncbi:hypothetical protein ACR3K2_05610 [Cryptosporidium serpentis]